MKRLLAALGLIIVLATAASAQQFSTQTSVQPLYWPMTMCDTIAAGNNNRYVISDWVGWQHCISIDFISDQAGSLYWWNADSTQYANWAPFCSPRKVQDSTDCWWSFKAGDVLTITSKEAIDSLEVYNEGTLAEIRIIGQRR